MPASVRIWFIKILVTHFTNLYADKQSIVNLPNQFKWRIMINVSTQNTLVTRSELATRLKVHRNTVANLEKQGLINSIRVGSSLRYDYAETLSNLKSREKK
jgi:predicted transcriptional regulator